jgi:predicted ester cyclase
MLNYVCNVCGNTRKLSKATLEVVDGKIRTREALCSCGAYMQEESKEFEGFPNIKRTEPTLSNKNDKLWTRAKETLN